MHALLILLRVAVRVWEILVFVFAVSCQPVCFGEDLNSSFVPLMFQPCVLSLVWDELYAL